MAVRLSRSRAPEETADLEHAMTFEIRRLPYWSMLTLLAVTAITPFIVLNEWPDVAWDGIAVAALVAGIVSYTQLRTLGASLAVAISARGFIAIDTLGDREAITWEDVHRVTLFRVGWLRFLRVRTARISRWIPLEVKDAILLRDEVTRRAGRAHRLADALWRHLR